VNWPPGCVDRVGREKKGERIFFFSVHMVKMGTTFR
jgi:hypothetical protein